VLAFGALGGGGRGSVGFCFTDRLGGRSRPPYDSLNLSTDVGDDAAHVVANRVLVLEQVGLSQAVWLQAEHGIRIAVIGSADDVLPRCDGLATSRAGIGLGALSADCALVILADAAAGVVGVAHCGRPGLVAGVVATAVEVLRELGGAQLAAVVGPTVCGDCYQLPIAMAEEVVAVVPAARARPGYVDIRAGVVAQLRTEGVDVQQLVGGCTREDPAAFSYRRDGTTGRMAALGWITP
jgi:YfiH family protein